MAKKRKTLPADFEELVAEGNFSKLKAVFEKCEANACGGYGKGNALCFRGISEEFIRWLVEQGADVNQLDTYGYPPISFQARDENGNFKLLLELGANIDIRNKFNRTPLFQAAEKHLVQAVKAFVENGADVNAMESSQKRTPLECSLSTCANIEIPRMAAIADILLQAGAKITPQTKEEVRRIGETFEFYRVGINKDFLPQIEESLEHLYKLFDVAPVAKRKVYDGISPIEVKAIPWKKQFNELWNLLVPGKGSASTVQGEIIRIAGKISYEVLENGGLNWDKEYKRLLQALPSYFAMGNPLEPRMENEARELARDISAGSNESDLDHLCELAVKWVLINPNPITLPKVAYKR
jgi:hypothetical protein